MSIQVEIGKNIILLRKEKRISQERLALDSDMSVSYLRSIEHGTANPTIYALVRIADTLDVPLLRIISPEAEAALLSSSNR
jgi:transcriptional regulator with XRE-family HTH domain